MIVTVTCWRCFYPHEVNFEQPEKAYSCLCPGCHAAEVARVHEFDTPPAPDYPTPPGPYVRPETPRNCGRRVLKLNKSIQ